MKKYIGSVQNNRPTKATGNAAVNATVTVRDARDGSKASLYDDDFVTAIDNPVATDNNGKYYFNVQDGVYNIVINEGLSTEVTNRNVYIFGDADIHFKTKAELLSSRIPVGKYVTVAELGDAPFLIEPAGSTVNLGGMAIANNNVANLDKSQGFVKPEWYGAKADRSTDDHQAIQDAINDNLVDGVKIVFSDAYYRTESALVVTDCLNLTLIGHGAIIQANFSSDERIIVGDDANGLYVEGIEFNQRYTATGFGAHIISLQDPRNCKFVNCSFKDYDSFGVLMYSSDNGASAVAKNNHIYDCEFDGYNVANGGFALESMIDCTVSCSITRVTQTSPGFSANFKNNCINCHMDVIISDSYQGVCFSEDTAGGVGAGVKNSTARATVTNCNIGASFNKCENVSSDLTISCTGSAGDVGLGIAGANTECDHSVSLANCDPAGYAITSRSDYQVIRVRRYDMSANKLLYWEPGTDRNRLLVDFAAISGGGINIANIVDDDNSNLNNEIMYARDCPSAINSAGTWSASMVFPIRGSSRTDNSITVDANGRMQFRTSASTNFLIDPANSRIAPSGDNSLASGGASNRWTEVFAANGTINTSDQREKQQIRNLTAAELAVATQCKSAIKAFKWNEAVSSKGDDGARWHVGWIAQEVQSIFESNGLDAFAYGILCYDEWEDDGGGNRYGLRKDELIAFIISVL